jgi:hypothetical protein
MAVAKGNTVKAILAAVCLAALAACGTPDPQAVTVTMSNHNCEVQPADLKAGQVNFAIRNVTTQPVTFKVTENGGADVGGVNVAPAAVIHLTVRLDDEDAYHLACGAVSGPNIKPS